MPAVSSALARRAVAGAVSLLAAAPAGALAAGQVELRPAAGPAGTTMELDGSGFPASARVRVTATGLSDRSVKATRSGDFSLKLKAPRRHKRITIASRGGGKRVVNRFAVTSGASAGAVVEVGASGGQRVRVSPASFQPGGTLRLSGSGFAEQQRLTVTAFGRSVVVRAARTGSFKASLRLPASLSKRSASSVSVSGSGVKLSVRLGVSPAPTVAPAPVPTAIAQPTAPVTIAPTADVVVVKPASTGAPAITGTAKLGQTVTASAGRWDGSAPLSISYQWRRCDGNGAQCTDIAGETAATHVVADADVAGTLRVVVTAANAAGAEAATSPQTAVVTAAPQNLDLPVVGGTPQEGKTLTAGSDTWSGYPAPKSTDKAYQWLRCSKTGTSCQPISKATKVSYPVSSTDVDSTLAVRITVTTSAGSATVTSLPTGLVTAAPPPTGVAALWHMDDVAGSTTMRDFAGTHNGTLSSGVTAGVPGGFSGTAFAFNGSNGNVRVPAADLNPDALDVTVTLHMKTTLKPPADGSVEDWDLFKKGSYYKPGTKIGQPEIKMEYYPSGQASCGWAGTDGLGNLTFHEIKNIGPVLDDGLWHTIQCVKTSTFVKLVVDGVSYGAKTIAIGSISNADDIVIGSHATGTEWFNGLIDEVSIAYG